MLVEGIINTVAQFLSWLIRILPDFSVDISRFTNSYRQVVEIISFADKFLPIQDLLIIVSLTAFYVFVLLMFWAFNWLIKKIPFIG